MHFDLNKYKTSKKVVEELPKLIEILNEVNYSLYPYTDFGPVSDIILKVKQAKQLVKIQLDYYEKIHNEKGMINVSKEK